VRLAAPLAVLELADLEGATGVSARLVSSSVRFIGTTVAAAEMKSARRAVQLGATAYERRA